MAVNTTSITNSSLATTTSSKTNPKGILGKDDFMKLLLVQLEHQDPTAPMNTEKILTQTSQLAALESADNTKKALEKLAASLGNAQQFSTISAIGKTANLGSDAVSHNKGKKTSFEVYFPKSVEKGTVSITDTNGKTVKTLNVGKNPAGVYRFTWDGTNELGNQAASAVYHVKAQYIDKNGATQQTKLGAYPIEAIRFDKGNTLVKLGSHYIPLNNIKEIY